MRRHAGRKAEHGRVAARGRPARAAGEEVEHAAALLRVAGGAARDLHRPGAVPLDLRGVQVQGVRPRPGRHVGGRHTGWQRPLDRRCALRDDGRRAEGVMARALFSPYSDTRGPTSALAVLGCLLMGDPRAPRDRPRDATNSPLRAASQGARRACCPAWPQPGRAPSAP